MYLAPPERRAINTPVAPNLLFPKKFPRCNPFAKWFKCPINQAVLNPILKVFGLTLPRPPQKLFH